MICRPTQKQVQLANSLGIPVEGKTFCVLRAEIADELDRQSDAYIRKYELEPGDVVKYVGHRNNMPHILVISSYGKNCYLYFKTIHSYCRPWDVKPLTKEELKELIAEQGT